MRYTDDGHPFWQPLWRRVTVCVVVAAWTLIEMLAGDSFWSIITLCLLVYAVWTFLIRWDKPAKGGDAGSS